MPRRVALLSSDSRMVYQIRDWFRDNGGDLRLEVHSTLADFLGSSEKKGSSPQESAQAQGPPDPEANAPIGSESPTGPRLAEVGSPLRLLIVDLELLPQLPLKWIVETRKILRERGQSPEDHPTRILVLGFEGSHMKIEQLRHESIDDLVLKPLDRALFLQKVELLTADDAKVRPSFLFRQKTSITIEAGKDAVIDEISEFAVAIRNPNPLMEGLYAALHCEVFGEKNENRVLGRVYQNARHPTIEGEYLVRFAYFGITEKQLSNVRRYVRAHHVPVHGIAGHGSSGHHSPSHPAQGHPSAKSKPGSARDRLKKTGPAKEEGPRRRIAVIDMNRETTSRIQETLQSNFENASVSIFPSYSRLLGGLARLSSTKDEASGARNASTEKERLRELQSEIRRPAFPGGKSLTVILNAEDLGVVRMEPNPKSGDLILGREPDQWAERPDLWRLSLEPNDKDEFEEFLAYLRTGAKGHVAFRMVDHEGYVVYLEAAGAIEKSGEDDGLSLIRLDVKEIERDKWHEIASELSHEKGASSFQFETVFVDGAVMKGEPSVWLEGLHAAMTKAGVFKDGHEFPKIIVLGDEKSSVRPDQFRLRSVHGFLAKPLDRRFLIEMMEVHLPSLQRLERAESGTFIPSEIPARIAKDVVMEELSEYGLTIRHVTPFKERVFMRFFSPLFGEDSEGVIGRCTLSEPVGEGTGSGEGGGAQYNCHFIFFGVSDDLLRRVRTWIREDYVHKKEAAGG